MLDSESLVAASCKRDSLDSANLAKPGLSFGFDGMAHFFSISCMSTNFVILNVVHWSLHKVVVRLHLFVHLCTSV